MTPGPVLALSGGVGGAKLASGLASVLDAGQLTVVCNTGDDFEHLGLHISPDLDSVMYALAGLNDTERGWGVRDESWHCLEQVAALGGDDWFRLGDRDLATHLLRSQQLAGGASLSEATAALCTALGIGCRLLPMSDDPVRTRVHCEQGNLAFQEYFVREQCAPAVSGFEFSGADSARAQADFLDLLADSALALTVICPSNPFVSVDPILAVPGVAEALRASEAPVVAVSPIVAGRAIKGPAAKMMQELGLPVDALSVARHYTGLADYFVLDSADGRLAESITAETGLRVAVMPTIMKNDADRAGLARGVLGLIGSAAP